MSDNEESEEIGYGKPPKEFQWPKGRSGNPAGRKKTPKDFGTAFRKVAFKKTPFFEGGHKRRISMIEAVIRAPLVNALKKDKRNARYALDLMEELGTEVYQLPSNPFGKIYYDYRRKPTIQERLLPRNLERLLAEFDRIDPMAAMAWRKETFSKFGKNTDV